MFEVGREGGRKGGLVADMWMSDDVSDGIVKGRFSLSSNEERGAENKKEGRSRAMSEKST